MNSNDEPTEVQPATGVAFLACSVSLALIGSLARPAVALLQVWWAELLVDALVPLLVTFAILYRGAWHREMSPVIRTCFLLWQSFVIFGGVLFIAGVTVVMAYAFLYRLTAFH